MLQNIGNWLSHGAVGYCTGGAGLKDLSNHNVTSHHKVIILHSGMFQLLLSGCPKVRVPVALLLVSFSYQELSSEVWKCCPCSYLAISFTSRRCPVCLLWPLLLLL